MLLQYFFATFLNWGVDMNLYVFPKCIFAIQLIFKELINSIGTNFLQHQHDIPSSEKEQQIISGEKESGKLKITNDMDLKKKGGDYT